MTSASNLSSRVHSAPSYSAGSDAFDAGSLAPYTPKIRYTRHTSPFYWVLLGFNVVESSSTFGTGLTVVQNLRSTIFGVESSYSSIVGLSMKQFEKRRKTIEETILPLTFWICATRGRRRRRRRRRLHRAGRRRRWRPAPSRRRFWRLRRRRCPPARSAPRRTP